MGKSLWVVLTLVLAGCSATAPAPTPKDPPAPKDLTAPKLVGYPGESFTHLRARVIVMVCAGTDPLEHVVAHVKGFLEDCEDDGYEGGVCEHQACEKIRFATRPAEVLGCPRNAGGTRG